MNQPTPDNQLLRHPFFEEVTGQPDFTDCINAIDRARSMIVLCNTLKLGEEDGGLTSDEAFGFYWGRVLTSNALEYVSARLVELNSERGEKQRQTSACLSALFNSLPAIGNENREELLNHTATRLSVSRLEVEELIESMAET
ncbi:MAG: hypothetical protein AB2551_12595 [Candidatus Thiodiazotropha sp.]